MSFSTDQRTWLETAQNKSADYAGLATRMEEKSGKLASIQNQVETLREELEAASRELTVTWDEDQKKHFWNKSKKEMKWMTGDRDVEIDTVHDLTGGFDADPEKVKRVQKLQEQLVAIQTEMETATGEDGEPLFEPQDIERELWSPLVRADIIPSNAVADKYSQEAQVWNGACKIYQEKLEDYTKTASKYDQVQRGLKIAADTLTLIGAVATESIRAANFEGLTISREDNAEYQQALKRKNEDSPLPTDAKLIENHEMRVNEANVAKRDMAITALAIGVVNGGLDVADKALDKPDTRQGFKIAEAIYDALETAATQSLTVATTSIKVADSDKSKEAHYKTVMASTTSMVKYGFKAGKIVFRAAEIADASDSGGQKKAAQAMVAAIAGAVGNAFAAFDTQSGKDSQGNDVAGTNGQWTKIGAAVQAAIIGAANTGVIIDQIVQAKQSGGKVGNIGALIAACGLTVIGPTMMGLFTPLSDVARQDVDYGEDIGVHEETPKEKELREKAVAGALAGLADQMDSPMGLLDNFPSDEDAKERRAALADKLAEEEAALKAEEINAFKDRLKNNEEVREAFLADCREEVGNHMVVLEKLMEEAKATPDDLEDEEKAAKAMAAMDKLIAEAAALNSKWDAINSLTSGGTAILVAALPVAGLVAAIQKLAMDVAILVRKSIELNKWLDNLALTYGNSSVYGPAISGRVASAKVQVSQQSVRVVFDSVGVTADACKLADITGISTGISIGNNMARALTEYGFKMAKEAECSRGWQLYKLARASQGDRKRARKAMKWNSTLSKCVLAYGIVMDGDPIAKEVARSCGMTPEVLVDQKDVCQKVVTYFETLYSDDAVILRRVPITQDWHPGTPILSFDSWIRFKAAAADRASPPISDKSTQTPKIDKAFAQLRDLIGMSGNYSGTRDAEFPETDLFETGGDKPARTSPKYRDWLDKSLAATKGLVDALNGYGPVTGPCPQDADPQWIAGARHEGMMDVVDSLLAQALLMKGEIEYDLKQNDALLAQSSKRSDMLAAIGSSVTNTN